MRELSEAWKGQCKSGNKRVVGSKDRIIGVRHGEHQLILRLLGLSWVSPLKFSLRMEGESANIS